MSVTLWVVGGPGSGKGTQCERIVKKYGFLHLSSGDLLREEVASGTPRGSQLQELMSQGLFVPSDVVLALIKERINKGKEENVPGFLIDGYPRELGQGLDFEKEIGAVDLVIFFDVENETLTKRLLGRAASSGRADDNEVTIKKRIEVFNDKNGPIIDYYKEKVVKINAEGAVEEIFEETVRAIDAVKKV